MTKKSLIILKIHELSPILKGGNHEDIGIYPVIYMQKFLEFSTFVENKNLYTHTEYCRTSNQIKHLQHFISALMKAVTSKRTPVSY